MTIIAWDGHTLAADRRTLSDASISSTQKLFLWREGHCALAITGFIDRGLMLAEWYKGGGIQEKYPAFQLGYKEGESLTRLIVLRPDGIVWEFLAQPIPIVNIDPFAAWGSGRDIAMGAMAMGADARKAVEIASLYNSGCGNGCDAVDVSDLLYPQNKRKPAFDGGPCLLAGGS